MLEALTLALLIAAAPGARPSTPSPSPRPAVSISGTVMAVNGDLVQLRKDDGSPVSIDQQRLLSAGAGLETGGHYRLSGYTGDGLFVAGSRRLSPAPAEPGNGYPQMHEGRAGATIQGTITAIDGTRITLQQGPFAGVTVDDSLALDRGAAHGLAVGRIITANGFWSGTTFYATDIE